LFKVVLGVWERDVEKGRSHTYQHDPSQKAQNVLPGIKGFGKGCGGCREAV